MMSKKSCILRWKAWAPCAGDGGLSATPLLGNPCAVCRSGSWRGALGPRAPRSSRLEKRRWAVPEGEVRKPPGSGPRCGDTAGELECWLPCPAGRAGSPSGLFGAPPPALVADARETGASLREGERNLDGVEAPLVAGLPLLARWVRLPALLLLPHWYSVPRAAPPPSRGLASCRRVSMVRSSVWPSGRAGVLMPPARPRKAWSEQEAGRVL
ncbi:hypothetical protein E2C01_066924 [Portunus trituberculatus]|uniref:Uncharacterized protein n=1 Tax=Portunus trituberculatus TaxID=210409 RepID=A0A5B7HRC1_PORTR|nr:hypothetical protein [Portunus trituberculatus]